MKPYRPKFPKANEQAYIKRLRARQKSIGNLLDGALEGVLETIQESESARTDSITESESSQLIRVVNMVQRKAAEKYPASAQTSFLEKTASEVGKFTTGEQAKLAARVVTLDVTSIFRAGLSETYDAWISGNVALIKTIDERYFTQVSTTIDSAFRNGTNTRELIKDIRSRFEVSEFNAERIARDQIGKLNAEITRERQTQLGVVEYIWAASGDDRVRESHQEMDGKVCRYSDPPIVDGEPTSPGQPVLCRCEAIAVLPGETGDSVREMYGFTDE